MENCKVSFLNESNNSEVYLNCVYNEDTDMMNVTFGMGKNVDAKTNLGLAGILCEEFLKFITAVDQENSENENIQVTEPSKLYS